MSEINNVHSLQAELDNIVNRGAEQQHAYSVLDTENNKVEAGFRDGRGGSCSTGMLIILSEHNAKLRKNAIKSPN